MGWANLVMSIPWEKVLLPKREERKLSEALKPTAPITEHKQIAIAEPVVGVVAAVGHERPLTETIDRERQGDYCLACLPGKHLPRIIDALGDALNIAQKEGQFTEVAESKIQRAVYQLNGAEEDLEQAQVSARLTPIVEELRIQIRTLRNFLRVDQSGLELATLIPEEGVAAAIQSLQRALNMAQALRRVAYDLVKLHVMERSQGRAQISA